MKAKQLLIYFIKDRKWSYIIGSIILLITSVLSSFVPKLLGMVTDGLNTRDVDRESILHLILLMVLLSATVFAFRFCWRYLLIGNCRNVECYLRDKLFEHLQTLPLSFYNRNKTGDLMAHAINDIQAIRMVFGFGFVAILEGLVVNSVSIYLMVKTINPILTLMALIPVPVVVILMTWLRKEIRRRFDRVQRAYAVISEKVQENISGIRVVKSFSQEKAEVEDFLKYSQQRVDTYMHLTKISASLAPTAQICFGISFLLFIIFGSRFVINGTITLGDYVAFNTYIAIIMNPIINISRIIEIWQKGTASFRRLNTLFSSETDIIDPAPESYVYSKTEASAIKGGISIKNLTFSYPGCDRAALSDINLELSPGKTLGILGTTGSGKTTLVNLLLRLYPILDSHIFIDGTDVNKIPLEKLRESIGYVPQDNFLFSTTIRKNIEFYRKNTEDDAETAAKLAGVFDNIIEFPEGFETIIGERGVTLSGGQKQRISIARAFIKDPSILILDDSLSAVDTKTEELILGNIKEVLSKRTGIMISHRVSTVKHADEIIFMDEGRIVEKGTHEELMSMGGMYANLYMLQTSQQNESDKENTGVDDREEQAI